MKRGFAVAGAGVAIVVSLLVVVSCSKPFPGATMPTSTSTASITERWTSDGLTKAFAAINHKIGANPADYIDVTIIKYNVAVKAINPQNRQNVDEYKYDGSAVTVTPVDVSHNEPGVIEESAFKSDTVKPSILATALNSAVKDSGVPDVTVDAVKVTKSHADDPAPVLSVNVSGPRASKQVRYDLATGQFQRVI